MVIALLEDFGCDVVRCPVLLHHFLTRLVGTSCAEVDNCNACLIAVPIQKQVLRLEIPVDYIATVAVVYRGKNLLDDIRCILLAEYLLLSDPLE